MNSNMTGVVEIKVNTFNNNYDIKPYVVYFIYYKNNFQSFIPL